MNKYDLRRYGPILIGLLQIENDPLVLDKIEAEPKAKLLKKGLIYIETGPRERARLKPAGTAAALDYLAGLYPPALVELKRAMEATAAHLRLGHPAPLLSVEHPPAGPPPAAPEIDAVDLAARAALGLVPGLSITIRPPSAAELDKVGIEGKVRVRLDILDRPAPAPEVEAAVPAAPFWVGGWVDAIKVVAGEP